jgi:hypothetical protein
MMVSVNLLKKKVYELNSEVEEIQGLGIGVLEAADFENNNYLRRPDYRTPEGDLQRETVQRYQRWYATSYRLVEEYIPEWLDTFMRHYAAASNNRWGTNGALEYLTLNTLTHFENKDAIVADFK